MKYEVCVHFFSDYLSIWKLHEQFQERCCIWFQTTEFRYGNFMNILIINSDKEDIQNGLRD